MSTMKEIATETNGLIVVDDAPIQQIDKSAITAAVERMRVIVPNGNTMSNAQLTVIAQEAILYRLVPGRDVHYFTNGDKLERVYDYKYLKNFSTFKEQLLSGDDCATLDDTYHTLAEEDKIRHGIKTDNIAAACTITTERERKAFAAEVKRWLDLDFEPQQAVAMAKETYGELGTTAIGHVPANTPTPKGWSPLQLAEKLAFKNAVNRKYGIPTADEMSTMAYRMAQRAQPEDWKVDHITEPIDIQARLADMEAVAREVQEASADLTPEERIAKTEPKIEIMRGPVDDDPIDEESYPDSERGLLEPNTEDEYYQ